MSNDMENAARALRPLYYPLRAVKPEVKALRPVDWGLLIWLCASTYETGTKNGDKRKRECEEAGGVYNASILRPGLNDMIENALGQPPLTSDAYKYDNQKRTCLHALARLEKAKLLRRHGRGSPRLGKGPEIELFVYERLQEMDSGKVPECRRQNEWKEPGEEEWDF